MPLQQQTLPGGVSYLDNLQLPAMLLNLESYVPRQTLGTDSSADMRGRRIRPNMTYGRPDARGEIRAHDNYLYWQLAGGWVPGALEPGGNIDFRELGTQTFEVRCNPPFNTMEEKKGDAE